MKEPAIYVIQENDAWVKPLFDFLDNMQQPYHNWFINKGMVNINDTPPEGVFYNRMSASSHTRDHRYAVELSETILAWLELHNRRVINDRNALNLEVRKSEQLIALKKFNIKAPASIIVNNLPDLAKAAKELNLFPFIVKPNRGGKGTGVKLYNTIQQLENDIENKQVPTTLDGIWIVQQYVKPANGRITRVELIGGKFYYAVSVDASGGFELCPADACNIGDLYCPADSNDADKTEKAKFRLIENYQNPDIEKYEAFFKASGIGIGALEYVMDQNGNRYVYDVNTNTNYNSGSRSKVKQRVSRYAPYCRVPCKRTGNGTANR